jgi:hypothetical protein
MGHLDFPLRATQDWWTKWPQESCSLHSSLQTGQSASDILFETERLLIFHFLKFLQDPNFEIVTKVASKSQQCGNQQCGMPIFSQ